MLDKKQIEELLNTPIARLVKGQAINFLRKRGVHRFADLPAPDNLPTAVRAAVVEALSQFIRKSNQQCDEDPQSEYCVGS